MITHVALTSRLPKQLPLLASRHLQAVTELSCQDEMSALRIINLVSLHVHFIALIELDLFQKH